MRETVRLRKILPEDVPAVLRLERACFSDPWSENGILSSLESPLSWLLAAEEEGTIRGYLIAVTLFDEGELLRIGTDPACRGRGIARAMLEEMFRAFPSVAVWRLDVRESNTSARRLYEAMCFENVIRRRDAYEKPREDGIMMMKRIPENGTGR